MVHVKILEEKSGQWILLSGFTVALIIIGLALLLNQAMISSHQSTQAEQDFPKTDILELRSETYKEAIRMNLNENVTSDDFNNTMKQYLNNLEIIYLMQGEHVNLNIVDSDNGTAVNVKIEFTDGITEYMETGIV
ncbi:MAG: hypothetical protein IMY70_01740 [Bacteroidetes bacterium]|nr:hypothetical protein [Bacteroidota bacterium]